MCWYPFVVQEGDHSADTAEPAEPADVPKCDVPSHKNDGQNGMDDNSATPQGALSTPLCVAAGSITLAGAGVAPLAPSGLGHVLCCF